MLWKRWTCEYVAALRQRHHCKGDGSPKTLWIGDVVILGGDESNHGKWPMGVAVHLFMVEMESCETSNSLQEIFPLGARPALLLLELLCDGVR